MRGLPGRGVTLGQSDSEPLGKLVRLKKLVSAGLSFWEEGKEKHIQEGERD